ncbi:YkyA family protein [Bacillus pinisoli]|uniref:YkyA family protein n=1 Tax=Bacillus pinisoli TaxID=2901866 RepID=UPI001FF55B7F|nr:YkyA family protein [Bacillus pinisoli]
MRYIIKMICLTTLFLITACTSGPTPAEQIYVHLEQAVKLETEFEQQQKPITDLEQQEKELYNQIIELGLKEIEKIKELSAEATKIVDERKARLEQEYESIKQSKAEFDKITQIVAEMKTDELKQEAETLIDIMNERFQTYESLYSSYLTSISLDQELYAMFQQEDLTLEALEGKINEINTSYEQVIQLNESFNSATTQYNEQKKNFYETAGLEVSYEK